MMSNGTKTHDGDSPPEDTLHGRVTYFLAWHLPLLLVLGGIVFFNFGGLLADGTVRSHEGSGIYMRTYQYFLELHDGNIPPIMFRYSSWGGQQAGAMFYPPLFHLLSSATMPLVGYTITLAVNTVMFLSVLFSAWFAYHCFYQICRWPLGAFLSALVYTISTYRFVVIFVRSASAEALTLVFLPPVIAGIWVMMREKRIAWYMPLAIAAVVLAHSATALYNFSIFALFFPLVLWYRRWAGLALWMIAFLLGVGLTVWFVIPVFYHMPELWASEPHRVLFAYPEYLHGSRVFFQQFFYSQEEYWRAGSLGDLDDEMSFQLGWGQMLFPLLLSVVLVRWFRGYREEQGSLPFLLTTCFVYTGCLVFMMFPYYIVKVLPPQYLLIQFPWRLLGQTAFYAALGIAVALRWIPRNVYTSISIIVLAFILQALVPAYQRTAEFYGDWKAKRYTETEMLYAGHVGYTAGGEYLPKSFPEEDYRDGSLPPFQIKGGGEISGYERIDWARFKFESIGKEVTRIVVPIMYYSFWKAETADGEQLKTEADKGFTKVHVPEGPATVYLYREPSHVMWWSLFASIATLAIYPFAIFATNRWLGRKKKKTVESAHEEQA